MREGDLDGLLVHRLRSLHALEHGAPLVQSRVLRVELAGEAHQVVHGVLSVERPPGLHAAVVPLRVGADLDDHLGAVARDLPGLEELREHLGAVLGHEGALVADEPPEGQLLVERRVGVEVAGWATSTGVGEQPAVLRLLVGGRGDPTGRGRAARGRRLRRRRLVVIVVVAAADQRRAREAEAGHRRAAEHASTREPPPCRPRPVVLLAHRARSLRGRCPTLVWPGLPATPIRNGDSPFAMVIADRARRVNT